MAPVLAFDAPVLAQDKCKWLVGHRTLYRHDRRTRLSSWRSTQSVDSFVNLPIARFAGQVKIDCFIKFYRLVQVRHLVPLERYAQHFTRSICRLSRSLGDNHGGQRYGERDSYYDGAQIAQRYE